MLHLHDIDGAASGYLRDYIESASHTAVDLADGPCCFNLK